MERFKLIRASLRAGVLSLGLILLSLPLQAQSLGGPYILTAVDAKSTFVSRAETELTVTDAYGLGITLRVSTIPAAIPFTSHYTQLSAASLSLMGAYLSLNFNADGTFSVADYSHVPTIDTIKIGQECTTLTRLVSVDGVGMYTLYPDISVSTGGYNVLGIPGIANGIPAPWGTFGIDLQTSLSEPVFGGEFPTLPAHPALCDPYDACFPFTIGDIDGSGSLEIYPDENLLGIPEYVPGGQPLTGLAGGFYYKSNTWRPSRFPGNTPFNLYMETHTVDGISSGTGFGDDVYNDEDGDGTKFDRHIGIPAIRATHMNPACGFSQPIFGDVSGYFAAQGMGFCVEFVDQAVSGYVMDQSGIYAQWGDYFTAHAALFTICKEIMSEATCAAIGGGILLSDDSAADFDSACLSDYNPMDISTLLDCSGRLTMNFDVPCVPVIEAREKILEFKEICNGSGDINQDGNINVMDVVALVNCVLTNTCEGCVNDMNQDGDINVMDVVALVNAVLTGEYGEYWMCSSVEQKVESFLNDGTAPCSTLNNCINFTQDVLACETKDLIEAGILNTMLQAYAQSQNSWGQIPYQDCIGCGSCNEPSAYLLHNDWSNHSAGSAIFGIDNISTGTANHPWPELSLDFDDSTGEINIDFSVWGVRIDAGLIADTGPFNVCENDFRVGCALESDVGEDTAFRLSLTITPVLDSSTGQIAYFETTVNHDDTTYSSTGFEFWWVNWAEGIWSSWEFILNIAGNLMSHNHIAALLEGFIVSIFDDLVGPDGEYVEVLALAYE
ncbi:MAG: dockerin type I repeat-containing protein [Myxococcota bacterium]|jgi:hypothetical protein|nr:dockerin type I repeat-containing protein [Myxococcota bacterium]